jgi:hypothetical protein
MAARLMDVFFYGLFMDSALLQAKGVHPSDVRRASVAGWQLRIGARATLVPAAGEMVHGLLMKLSQQDLDALYAEPSVREYRPEPVLARVEGGAHVAALCYNLPVAPGAGERNGDYARKLRDVAVTVGLPGDYVRSIA